MIAAEPRPRTPCASRRMRANRARQTSMFAGRRSTHPFRAHVSTASGVTATALRPGTSGIRTYGPRMSDPPSTPVAFTRGLLATGTWSSENGTYKDTGGHIAFLGGNIQFYPNLTEAATQLTLNNGRKGPSLLQALPFNPNAAINPRVYATPPAGLGSLAGTPAEKAP